MKQEMPNFDVLLKLAKHDPEQLEQIRQQLTFATIDAAPGYLRKRLLGLQFKIDTTRNLAKNPLAACIRLTEMMHQSFEELRIALNNPQPAEEINLPPSAQIIPFPGKR